MSNLVVRRLLIDLEPAFERHWLGGDPFRSAFMNALSMSFPVGEQFFIDSVRDGLQALAADKRAEFDALVRGFVGQEATHRRIHALFNAQLDAQGYRNSWAERASRRIVQLAGLDVRHALAATAANEHLTAILAEYLLERPELLAEAEPRLATMWLWHASEESEHRSVAFDIYRANGGDERWRKRWARIVTWIFLSDALRQTASILRHDGQLWRWRTWRSAYSFLLGPDGMIRRSVGRWRQYFAPDFHPSQQDDMLARDWLAAHSESFTPVGAPVAANQPA